MKRRVPESKLTPSADRMAKKEYEMRLHKMQIELVKLQRHFITCDDKILVLIEGRDAAGKDGVIKRIVQHLSPRETRVVALGKPSERDQSSWYFQRFTGHLPTAREFVLFNRSWYNRAGVEKVMGFATEEQHEEFMDTVIEFERMLVKAGIKLIKYYLDISRDEQKRRLADRRRDPLKQWKISPIDETALKHWDAYSDARNEMLARTHNPTTPWTIVKADEKRSARLNLIANLLQRLHYADKDSSAIISNSDIVFNYQSSGLGVATLAP
ncbi:polyphosphate kinase 2 [Neoroseomonas soli]|uniref:ADP/GDP-polyphosphate phosphotransferase n=1 Tax=Neoroseomonas soli TaxID=1081025 RepID=A0A9X9WZ94_9PROT|nr:polyphosphate kinase 2 [Neoroseomonas soli]MBR0672473.1 polyphosphate kinase 2 [Neoroseomonas soli]